MANRYVGCLVGWLALWAIAAHGAQPLIEEVLVTAQRIEEAASKVPIALSAFDADDIRDRQIIGISDLQLSVPNFSYIPDGIAKAVVAVRGIGTLITTTDRSGAGPGVPIHVNGLSAPIDVSVVELLDMERVEILRGPQGTLYGRNATAGSMNLVTKKPELGRRGGYVDVEYGDYDHRQLTGVLNLPLAEGVAVRIAGKALERDGYIDNKAADQLPGLKQDIDDRNIDVVRLTARWQPSDRLNTWLMYGHYREDDSKVRITNQVCKQTTLPAYGCEPDTFGMDVPNPLATTGALFAYRVGALDPTTPPTYTTSRPELSLWEQHTDFNPAYKLEEDGWQLGIEWEVDEVLVSFTTAYYETEFLSQQDYTMDVGGELLPTTSNPSGLWPVSALTGGAGDLRGSKACGLESGGASAAGGCILRSDLTRAFSYDQSDYYDEFWSSELLLRTNNMGKANYLLGANYLRLESEGDLYVVANMLDMFGLVGFPGFTQLYPSYFVTSEELERESYSIFGELYLDLTDQLKLAIGIRYSHDESRNDLTTNLYDAANVAPFFGNTEPEWVRQALLGFISPDIFGPPDSALAEFYGASSAIADATTPEELITALQIVPIAGRLGEDQALNDLPRGADWDAVTGRAVLGWSVDENTLIYASYSQGYRPGGINLNPGFDTIYDSERVNAFEIGAKSLFVDGSVLLKASLFFNDYDDLQIKAPLLTGGGDSTDNVDGQTAGAELELEWRPLALPSLVLELGYAWLETEIKNKRIVDIRNRAQGDPSLLTLKNVDPGLFSAYVAPADQVRPLVADAIASGAAVPEFGTYDNGVPVLFSRGFLDAFGVSTAEGVPANLNGNELPYAPNHSVNLAISHTWTLPAGLLTLRYDYFWQDESFSRAFNTPGDEIDSWEQHNASATFETVNGRWIARAWIRNLTDDTIVKAHGLTDNGSGDFRNYFLAEPRIYGASLRYNFGVKK
jgi:outer membrane receptor protein involved in Fe transport